jgi:ATP-dependent RNA helicase DeaD
VGRNHEVRPGDIVGAIANEANIESRYIGQIKLFDEFSTVDLPQGLPSAVLNQLKKVRVRNRPLEISVDTGGAYNRDTGGDKPHREKPKYDKPKGDKPKIRDRDQKNKGYRKKSD